MQPARGARGTEAAESEEAQGSEVQRPNRALALRLSEPLNPELDVAGTRRVPKAIGARRVRLGNTPPKCCQANGKLLKMAIAATACCYYGYVIIVATDLIVK